jgi:hypothetical protein
MFRTRGTLLFLASFALLSPAAQGAEAAAVPGCAQIAADAERLACYDLLFGSPARTGQAEPSFNGQAVSSLAVAAPTTASAVAPSVEDERRQFGLSEADKRRNENLPAAPDSISVTIESVSRRPTGEQIFRTQEGQTWVEVEPSSRLRVQPGETVTIRKAALGSYVLVTSSRVGAKVKRLN